MRWRRRRHIKHQIKQQQRRRRKRYDEKQQRRGRDQDKDNKQRVGIKWQKMTNDKDKNADREKDSRTDIKKKTKMRWRRKHEDKTVKKTTVYKGQDEATENKAATKTTKTKKKIRWKIKTDQQRPTRPKWEEGGNKVKNTTTNKAQDEGLEDEEQQRRIQRQ